MGWETLAAGGLGIIGGMMQNNAQIDATNAANQKAMDFAMNMSSTAHQREVADLKAAGLNPILSATHGGASTPSAPANAPMIQDVLSKGVSSAQASHQLELQNQSTESSVALNEAARRTEETKQRMNDASAYKIWSDKIVTDQEAVKRARDLNIGENAVADLRTAATLDADTMKKKAVIDNKTATFDAIQHKVDNVLGTVNSAKDVFMPRVPIKIGNDKATPPAYDRYDPKTWRYKDRTGNNSN